MSNRALGTAALALVAFAHVALAAPVQCSPPDSPWDVSKLADPEESQVINREAQRLGSPVFAVGVAYTIKRPEGVVPDDKEKRYTLKDWNYGIADVFDRYGLYQGSGTEGFQAQLDGIAGKMPYNQQQSVQETRGPVQFVINDIDPICLGDEDGLIGAYSFMSYPRPGVGSDWGAVTVIFIGMGSCGPDSAEAHRIARDLMRSIDQYICNELKELPQ
jgi:hypothetical protein